MDVRWWNRNGVNIHISVEASDDWVIEINWWVSLKSVLLPLSKCLFCIKRSETLLQPKWKRFIVKSDRVFGILKYSGSYMYIQTCTRKQVLNLLWKSASIFNVKNWAIARTRHIQKTKTPLKHLSFEYFKHVRQSVVNKMTSSQEQYCQWTEDIILLFQFTISGRESPRTIFVQLLQHPTNQNGSVAAVITCFCLAL